MQTSSDVFKYIRSVPLTSPRLIACSVSLRNSCTWRIVGGAKSITGMWCIFILSTPYSDGGSSVRDTKCWTPASARNVTSSLLIGLPRPANLLGTSHEKFKGIIIRHATRNSQLATRNSPRGTQTCCYEKKTIKSRKRCVRHIVSSHASKDGRFTRIAENTIRKKRSRKSTHKKSLTINNFMCSSSAILCPLTHNHCAPFHSYLLPLDSYMANQAQ